MNIIYGAGITSFDFGDRVRIRRTPFTEAAGIADAIGEVWGVTKPSSSGVRVLGEVADDLAVNVHFEGPDQELWLSHHLVELIDHGAGTRIELEGVPHAFVKTESGGWREEPKTATPVPDDFDRLVAFVRKLFRL